MEDPYAILGVSRSASADEIKTAYRRWARELHPDVNPGDAGAEERFKAISAAFEILGDSERKRLYDEFGDIGLRAGFDPEQARAFNRWQGRPGSGFGFGGRGFSGVTIEELFGADPFGGRTSPNRRGGDIRAAVAVELRDAVLGAEREITFERPDGGEKRLKVKIPAGIEDRGTLRLTGQGMAGPAGPGDLLLEISVRPHPHLRRQGRDLYLDVPVTVKEAMLGGVIDIPTFQGEIRLTVPPGSQSGNTLRVRGRGVSGATPGDLLVVLFVQVPDAARGQALAERAAADLDQLYPSDVRASLRL
jgi:curved DNA-binding protein